MTVLSHSAGSAALSSTGAVPARLILPQRVSGDLGIGGRPGERTVRLAVGFVLMSIAVLLALQAVALATMDPLRGTISGMVYAPGGFLLFAAMGALCATGSALLAVSLARRGAVAAAALVVIWCLALAVAAVVPTDPHGVAAVSLAAEIHRDAAAVMFTAMPLAGLLVAARRLAGDAELTARQRSLRRASLAAAAAGLLQIAVSVPSLFPGSAVASWPAAEVLYSVRGLAERALFVVLFVVLIRIAVVVSHSSPRVDRYPTRPAYSGCARM